MTAHTLMSDACLLTYVIGISCGSAVGADRVGAVSGWVAVSGMSSSIALVRCACQPNDVIVWVYVTAHVHRMMFSNESGYLG